MGVGLVALAALVVSLSVARQRQDARREEADPALARAPATAKLNLDALRSAGL